MGDSLKNDLQFLADLPLEVRSAFLDLLIVASPERHLALMKDLAARTVRGEMDIFVVGRCPRCRIHHREGTFCPPR